LHLLVLGLFASMPLTNLDHFLICSVIFDLLALGWFIYIYVSFVFSYGDIIFGLCPLFQECNYGVKQ